LSDQALYRKYRSATFDEVIGQEHVVKTLTSAITNGRFSHAYLFTGPRGVGKTSVARLLARALNCTGSPKPCNECANCLAAINSSLDVVEIDAASNRSIDSVRDLRDKVALAPTQGRYKIYIIDEVHMLTNEAFNALLKTLEEPPAHAVFVLATTEAHKAARNHHFAHSALHLQAHRQSPISPPPRPQSPKERTSRSNRRLWRSSPRPRAADSATPSACSTSSQPAAPPDHPRDRPLAARLLQQRGDRGAGYRHRSAQRRRRPHRGGRLEASGAQPGQVAIQLADLWRAVLLAGSRRRPQPDPAARLAAARSPSHGRRHRAGSARSHPLALAAARPRGYHRQAHERCRHASRRRSRRRPAGPSRATPKPAPAPEPAPATTGTLEAGLWPKVLVVLKPQNNNLTALLQMYPVDFGDGEVTIKPKFNFHRDLLLKPVNRTMIEAAAAKVYGRPVKVSARTDEAGGQTQAAQVRPDRRARLVRSRNIRWRNRRLMPAPVPPGVPRKGVLRLLVKSSTAEVAAGRVPRKISKPKPACSAPS
jgi:DNA polymerase III delta prime subunit